MLLAYSISQLNEIFAIILNLFIYCIFSKYILKNSYKKIFKNI